MKQVVNKIWKDPVWSKVISVGILGLITLLYNYITSLFNGSDFKIEFIKFWTFKIELWKVALLFIFLFAIFWFVTVIKKLRSYKYDPEILELDRQLFQKIRTVILPQDTIYHVKQSGFADGDFPMNLLFKVFEILNEDKKADFHFFNPQLNKKKNELLVAIQELRSITQECIFGVRGQKGMLGIPREWVHEQPERYRQAVDDTAIQEEIMLEAYDNFIREGRLILKV
ncbi:hypothetical protein DVR12_00085 [Chitinophaga silvatica]|uniref:Uncharacterized protein n=1 Tax=Chitinophaga silvatica TaxID=2282649 RepID=A0A3E1YFP2_9BACT|nr:hypothetical protein [Chitinophaga silvatica]RFS26225.1 hypothetical protein DVR12_00085 [Chitinophaga silvatica]